MTCRSIHGDKRQVERKMILDDFLNGCFEVLVATSLLGRGIDLLNVKMVSIIVSRSFTFSFGFEYCTYMFTRYSRLLVLHLVLCVCVCFF